MSDEEHVYPPPERRNMIGLTQEEHDRLIKHMALEEQRERHQEDKFVEGEQRMQRIEEDLRPLRALYHAVVGSGAVATLLLGTLLFIYSDDKSAAKQMQEAIYKQGVVIERILISHNMLEADYRRTVERIEREHADFPNGKKK